MTPGGVKHAWGRSCRGVVLINGWQSGKFRRRQEPERSKGWLAVLAGIVAIAAKEAAFVLFPPLVFLRKIYRKVFRRKEVAEMPEQIEAHLCHVPPCGSCFQAAAFIC